MKIEIWSDVMCPFCYIGKRRFEKSLENSSLNDSVEIEWKSFQLNPDLQTDPSIRIDEYLALHKGMPVDQAKALNTQVTQMAAEEGLVYNFDKSVVANSFRAHVLTHFAKKYHKQDEVEELLFQSYFTDGKNIDDIEVLKNLAEKVGLNALEYEDIVAKGTLDDEVKMDINEARQMGVQGVPFFVYDRKYAVSGAQPVELFAQTLEKAFAEWKSTNS
ncbi:DsbA family oxidoreductase [Sphingobacterium sp. WQ 366]|uniref:DsbA family oxidoreductase n=2 Tax=Sphingobacterium bovistauri TaxID=2781959 RepID=A0ABS7Z7T3_9SPHI|nr:DsbA family oxidoreductase [Sphingobacterium bovistauri]